jgi:2-oxoglutarate dehydrogenase E2 component (dihydrolipoamide succinyltransferase)
MPIELKVPEVGESITEVMVGTWKKQEGDAVAADDSIVEIESDKATVELPAPAAGRITKVLKGSGEKAVVGEVIGYMEPASVAAGAAVAAPPQSTVGVKRAEGTTTIGSVQPPAAPVMPPRVMPSAARVLGALAQVLLDAVVGLRRVGQQVGDLAREDLGQAEQQVARRAQ